MKRANNLPNVKRSRGINATRPGAVHKHNPPGTKILRATLTKFADLGPKFKTTRRALDGTLR